MKTTLAACAGLVVLSLSSVAAADVIPGPPQCPAGQVPVMSHDHIGCVLAPPKNCPPGWLGIRGGHCVLHTCETSCYVESGPPLECRPFQACADLRTVRGHSRRSGNDFQYDEWIYSGLCESGCKAPATCRATGVCLPKGVAKVGAAPANAKEHAGATPRDAKDAGAAAPPTAAPAGVDASAAPAPSSSAPAPSSSAPPPSTAAPPASVDTVPSGTAPRSGGCSGCRSSGGTAASLAGLCLVVGVAAAAVRRRPRD
ncbi:MAG: hypothetical protein JNL38_15910 [Myxococcales bacterium]|nr:hypothetical protein [Myxococcales bacterium]